MKYGVVIQARMSSSRLPGKVLMDIEGKPMLLRQVERLSNKIKNFPIIVATSEDTSDDEIEALCKENDINVFRGSLENVMFRFIECAKSYNLDFIVRVGGDDPLADPDCCLKLISDHKIENNDFIYASNKKGWPYGSASELISMKALEAIHANTDNSFYREHTIPYFFDNKEKFNIKKLKASKEIHRPEYFFTVDFPEDLELIREIFKNLLEEDINFSFKRVIEFIDDNQHLLKINNHLHIGFEN